MHHLFLCVLLYLFVERAWFEQSVGKIDLTEVRWGVWQWEETGGKETK